MKRKLPPIAAFITLWGVVFLGGHLAARVWGPGPRVLLAMVAGPAAYAAGWHLHRRFAGHPAPPQRPAPFLFFLNFFVSDLLQILQPFALAILVAQLAAMVLPRARVNLADPVRLRLPFRGTWLVGAGGTTRRTSHSWSVRAQRYAYDFVVGTSLRDTAAGGGTRLEDYPAYGQPVLAPADGTVASVRRTDRDAPFPGTGWLDWRARDPRGNHVLIECRTGVFVLLAHLRPGSVAVQPGQVVRVGTPVGECGNSGRSTEPHLHLHCQRGRSLAFGVGLPVVFTDAADPLVERGRQAGARTG